MLWDILQFMTLVFFFSGIAVFLVCLMLCLCFRLGCKGGIGRFPRVPRAGYEKEEIKKCSVSE